MEIFQKKISIKKNEDVINLIDIPKRGSEIDIGFKKLPIVEETPDGEFPQS